MPQVKICGITRPEDARRAEAAGASYVGCILVSGSPRLVTRERAADIAAGVQIPLVLVTADHEPGSLVSIAREVGASGLQLHGNETPEHIDELRQGGRWELWKAVRVRSRDDVLGAFERFGRIVDLILLDAWQEGVLGGTGRTFPWDALDSVGDRQARGSRIGVAGGLDPDNVAEAVRRLTPDLVDVSSGVESRPGVKDPALVDEFVRKARSE